MKTLKVEENKDLVRSVDTGAILSIDKESLLQHRRRRSVLIEQESRIENLESTVHKLEAALNKLLHKANTDD